MEICPPCKKALTVSAGHKGAKPQWSSDEREGNPSVIFENTEIALVPVVVTLLALARFPKLDLV